MMTSQLELSAGISDVDIEWVRLALSDNHRVFDRKKTEKRKRISIKRMKRLNKRQDYIKIKR